MKLGGGSIAQLLAFLLLDPGVTGIPSVPPKCSGEKIVAVGEVNQRHCVEERGQWLENIDRTLLVLSSGKLVLQKINI